MLLTRDATSAWSSPLHPEARYTQLYALSPSGAFSGPHVCPCGATMPASSLDPASLRTKVPSQQCLPKARIAMHGHDHFMDALFCCSAARRSATRVVIRYRKGYTRGGLPLESHLFVNKQRTSFALRAQHLMFVRIHICTIILRLGE